MKPTITTAIIATAGWGTRWLPLTKAIEKCMVPVGNRPVIDWIVRDCVTAGIQRIIFVVDESHTQIQQYFSHNAALNKYLTNNKEEKLLLVQQPEYTNVSFEYVTQFHSDKYGTAIPLLLTAEKLTNEPFLYLMGDDFVYRRDGGNEIIDFIAAWQHSGAKSALLTSEVARELAPKYGVVLNDEQGHYQKIIEKPSLDEITDIDRPTINIAKYIFAPEMIRYTIEYVQQKTNNEQEFYITDVLNRAVSDGHNLFVYRHRGEYLDAGNPESWLRANKIVMEEESGKVAY